MKTRSSTKPLKLTSSKRSINRKEITLRISISLRSISKTREMLMIKILKDSSIKGKVIKKVERER